MMFIYMIEQVWSDSSTTSKLNFETDEISRLYWDIYSRSFPKPNEYPCIHMEEGEDYEDY